MRKQEDRASVMSYIRHAWTTLTERCKNTSMTTDKPSFQPLYQQIRTLLAQRIAQGEWAAHEALPSEWALAESLGVSQGTVRKALTDLVDEGWLYRQQGKGTFVAPGLNEWGDGHLVTPGQFAEPPGSPVPELLSCTRANAS